MGNVAGKRKRLGKGAQECEAGGQEEAMLAQRLEGGEGLSHGDSQARAFPADGTAGSQSECVSGPFEARTLPDGRPLGREPYIRESYHSQFQTDQK